MKYQEPSLEILKFDSNVIVTSPGLQDSTTGGNSEGGNLEDIFG